jgi:hypothetical protein
MRPRYEVGLAADDLPAEHGNVLAGILLVLALRHVAVGVLDTPFDVRLDNLDAVNGP